MKHQILILKESHRRELDFPTRTVAAWLAKALRK